MFKNNCEEFFDPLPFTFDPRPLTLNPQPFTPDPRLVTLDQKANSSLAYFLHFIQEMTPKRIFHYLNCNDRNYNNYWFWLFLRALICHVILSVKKFSILFGSLFAYLSHAWCVITWWSHGVVTQFEIGCLRHIQVNRPRSIYQYSNMDPKLSDQNYNFFKFFLSLNS